MKNRNWMKMILFPALSFLASLFAVSVQATDIPLPITTTVTIEKGQTQTFSFPALSQQNTIVSLTSTARLDYPSQAGSNTVMTIKLNDKPVNGIVDRCGNRLIGMNSYAPITSTASWSWFADNNWRVVYAPDFTSATPSWYEKPYGSPYVLKMDITDLINSSSDNQLAITNSSSTYKLVLSGLAVSTVSGTSSILAAANVPAVLPPVINNGTPAGGFATYTVQVLAGGGFTINVGQRHWQFSSAFSYPNLGLSYPNSGQHFNKLVADDTSDQSGQSGWTVSKSGNNVTASGPNYKIDRSIQFTSQKVSISDTITNLSGTDLGLEVQHKVNIPADLNDPAVRLAGRDIITTSYYSPPNPSVHITDPDPSNSHSLGILCEDDVFRNQATLFLFPLTPIISAGIKTDKLYIAPNGSYTLQWSVYPVASQDYYDFVNLVREDWGSIFTVEGAWAFSAPETILNTDEKTLRDQFKNLGIKYICVGGGWVDSSQDSHHIGFGADVMNNPYWANERTNIKNAADKIHQMYATDPMKVKLLVYFNSQRDTSSDQSQFGESWLTNANGIHTSTYWDGDFDNPSWSMVGTQSNSFGQEMLTVAGRYMDEMYTDGLYWDEMEATGYGSPLITYNIHDGYSCLLTSNYTVSSQIGITQLLGKDNRQDITAAVKSRNGMILGNTPPFVRSLLTGQRMVETQHNDYWHYEGNLGSMLGYLSSYDNDFGKVTRLLKFAALPVGTSLSYTYQIFPYLFPFTPIEMHYGYLLGQERIITLHDGDYRWPNQRCLVQVRDFDANGFLLTTTDYTTTVNSIEATTTVAPVTNGAVVLVKLPVTLDPSGATATISQVSYKETGLQLNATVPSGATLQISDGTFHIQNGVSYMAKIGTSFQRIIAGNGILTVTISPGSNIPVQVWAPVTVTNPSFESPAIGNYSFACPTGWSGPAQCIPPVIPRDFDYIPDGVQVLYVNKSTMPYISQQLNNTTVQPGETYVFTASVGHARYDTHYIGYEMDILLDGVVVSSIKGLDSPGAGQWFVKSVSYTTQTGDAGKTLSIQLKSSPDYNGGTDWWLYTEFDNVFVDKVMQ